MSGLMTAAYVLTPGPDATGPASVHSRDCQLIPGDALMELGEYDSCAPAVAKAKEEFGDVNACPLCCNPCYEGSKDFQDKVA